MYKIDLHTHSILSPDGGITAAAYEKMLLSGRLDYAAVTDHNQIAFALELKKLLGDKIIVGEEIDTGEGELIGLFLKQKIEPMLGVRQTAVAIHQQKGLIYVPHPFETIRRGIQPEAFAQITDLVDIVETHNGRAYFNNKASQARQWAKAHKLAAAASSDAHGLRGWGKTFSLVKNKPTAANLTRQLANTEYGLGYVGPAGVLYPAINRARNRFKR